MRSRPRVVLTALVAGSLLAAACGGDDSTSTGASTTGAASTQAPSTTAPPTTAPSTGAPSTDPSSTAALSTAAPSTEATASGALAPQPLPERTKFVISPAVAIEPFASVYIADAAGEFEKENLDVSFSPLAPADGYVAISQGQAQVQVGGINAAVLNAVDQGVELRIIANAHQTGPDSLDGLWVRNEFLDEQGKVDAATMRSMKIAIGAGGIASTSALPVALWAQEQGVALDELQMQPLGGNDLELALENGAIDAGYVLSPAWIQTQASGCCTLVTPLPALAASTYTMSADFLADEPEVAQAFFRAVARTNATYLQGDYHADEQVMGWLSEAMGVPADAIAQTPPLIFDPDLGLNLDVLTSLEAIWIDNDVVDYDQPLAVERLVDRGPVEAIFGS